MSLDPKAIANVRDPFPLYRWLKDHEPVRWSDEIDDEPLDNLLSAKLDTAELTTAYRLPEGFL